MADEPTPIPRAMYHPGEWVYHRDGGPWLTGPSLLDREILRAALLGLPPRHYLYIITDEINPLGGTHVPDSPGTV